MWNDGSVVFVICHLVLQEGREAPPRSTPIPFGKETSLTRLPSSMSLGQYLFSSFSHVTAVQTLEPVELHFGKANLYDVLP